MVSGYADGGDAPYKRLSLVPGAVQDANVYLEHHAETRSHLDKVADLVLGFETPFGLELLSTVLWVVKNETVQSIEDIVYQTYIWNDRKRQFTQRQISLAVEVLSKKGWIDDIEKQGNS